MTAHVVLLVTSPRLPAGLLTAQAWDLLRSAPVYAQGETATVEAIRASGVDVTTVGDRGADEIVDLLLGGGTTVWLAGPEGDAGLTTALTGAPGGAEVEVVFGSWDPPGGRLLDVVAVMDRLRSPGGCPWDAEQTHASLTPYLLEEAYEAHDALVDDDLDALREELGDVLLQVAFHARLAEELPDDERWSIDDVAGELVAKLVRRHPHVFADVDVSGADEVNANWHDIKQAEKGRSSAVEGVALSQPALSLAAKYLSRAERAGIDAGTPHANVSPSAVSSADELGRTLFGLVAAARSRGLDAEAALRAEALRFAGAVRAAER
ncbi:MAG TPA: MazG family protein [Mycobacteriales bacterium]